MIDGNMTMRCGFLRWVRRTRQILLLAGVAVPGIGLSQFVFEANQLTQEEVEEIRRYTVEMIVFEYAANALSGTEEFLPDEVPDELAVLQSRELPEFLQNLPVLPPSFGDPGTSVNSALPVAIDDAALTDDDPLDFLLLGPPEEEQILEEFPSHILHTRLEILDPEQHAMPDIFEKLVERDTYKPIMRAAWTQATFEKDQTLPIRLRRLGNAPLRLDGILTLYLSRYLHLVVDLTIESETAQPGNHSDARPRYFGDARTRSSFGYGYERETAPVRYRIFEDRIFRNGELRYYDHPRFGVLARITRFEEEELELELETDELFLLPGN